MEEELGIDAHGELQGREENVGVKRGHERPGAVSRLQDVERRELIDGFADQSARDMKPFGELTLRRQLLARAVFAREDEFANLTRGFLAELPARRAVGPQSGICRVNYVSVLGDDGPEG